MGQKREPEGTEELHRGHIVPFPALPCRAPHCGQKRAPGWRLAPQEEHTVTIPGCCNGVPQVTQRLAVLGLSDPHLGHGLYSLPQCGQKRSVDKCFLEQLAQ